LVKDVGVACSMGCITLALDDDLLLDAVLSSLFTAEATATLTITGFLSPALPSALTALVCVALNKPVLRILGSFLRMLDTVCSNPISSKTSPSSRIRHSKDDLTLMFSYRESTSSSLPGVATIMSDPYS